MKTKFKSVLFDLLLVVIFAAAAIALHAILPSPGAEMDTSVFDSWLVKAMGFPAVASGYFVVLFLHILITIRAYAPKSPLGKWKTGLCFGAAYSLLYLGGMQEVMVSASPLTEYGPDFVLYELFLGLGDALPAFLLCIALCAIHAKPSGAVDRPAFLRQENGIRIAMIGAGFFLWRMAGDLGGIVDNELALYPAPVLLWTAIFGALLGVGYCLLLPAFGGRRKPAGLFLTIGVNWIWFNCYIGLIAAGAFRFMVLRAGADVLAVLLGSMLAERICRMKKHSEA